MDLDHSQSVADTGVLIQHNIFIVFPLHMQNKVLLVHIIHNILHCTKHPTPTLKLDLITPSGVPKGFLLLHCDTSQIA